jgi:peptidoglycan/xylan/chitin deacetylase (PgdA/CDA1 family)
MLRVLTYHRVANYDDSLGLHPRMISATPEQFARQMRFLANNYQVVSLAEVVDAVESKAPLPPRAVLITFDDAYSDFGEIAWPILKRFQLPATLFVPTAYPDHPERPFWWDRLYRALNIPVQAELKVNSLGTLRLSSPVQRSQSLQRLQTFLKTIAHVQAMSLVDDICAVLNPKPFTTKTVLSWDELRQLARQGVALGAHTRTHPIMTRLSPEEVREEVICSRCDLQREVGQVLPAFCYPSGEHDDTVIRILKEEAFALAFTTLRGLNDLRYADHFRLRRINITPRTTFPIFCFRLMRWVSRIDSWRQRRMQRRRQQQFLPTSTPPQSQEHNESEIIMQP